MKTTKYVFSLMVVAGFLMGYPVALSAGQLATGRLLQQAEAASRQAMALAEEHPEEADAQLEHARSLYESLVRQPDMASGQLYYNLGNIYARLEDYGRAILNYRRAQQYLPSNAQLQANLQFVRACRQDQFEEPTGNHVLQTLFFWHYDLAFHYRFWTAIVLHGMFWSAAIILIWKRPAWLRILTALLLLAAIAFGTSSAVSIYAAHHQCSAVILAKETYPRKGDGLSYDHAFDAPIHAGTEVTILRQRGDWYEIELPNHLTGWLPDGDLEAL